jgi:hypothetical protein
VWSPIRFTRPGARNQRGSAPGSSARSRFSAALANTCAGCRNLGPGALSPPFGLCDTSFEGPRRGPPPRSTIEQHKKRVVENEILFRDVNERLKGVSEGFGDVLPEFEIICECGEAVCTQRISLTLDQYEQLRADGTQFAVRPGHEALDIETIVEDHGGYLVVKKAPGRAATLARESDPRAAK